MSKFATPEDFIHIDPFILDNVLYWLISISFDVVVVCCAIVYTNDDTKKIADNSIPIPRIASSTFFLASDRHWTKGH